MKNTRRKKHSSVALSFFIVLFCLGGAAFSAYMFYKSLNATLTRTDGKIEGQITYKYHAVQRRFSNRFVWNSVDTGSDIYDGDIVRTDTLSDAKIVLNSGGEIQMAQNSLIQITKDRWGRVNLQLFSGDTSVKTEDESIIVNQGGKQLEMQSNTSIRAVVNEDNEESSFTVDNGNATLRSGDVTQEISTGTQVSVDSTGSITNERPVLVQSVTESLQQIQIEDSTAPVKLDWKANGERVLFEVSSDSRFTNIVISRIQTTDSTQVTLPPGYWWWRVTPYIDPDRSSAKGNVIITKVEPPPKILEPTASPVVLSFLSNEKPVSTAQEINRMQAIIDNTTPPITKVEEVPTPSQPKPLPAPRLMSPGAELDLATFRDNKKVRFSWSSVPGARAYLWTLQQGSLQTNVLVRENNFDFDASRIENGMYTWRVEALRSIPQTHYVSEQRGLAAERTWNVNIPLPKKPVLMQATQDDT
ncbi:MAG: hypothetical protein Ta2B_03960 [Termitinemataceae bacterium]|nr:MAG: hypothetical protein Ta2B_03960 [Termitinemataceae bacterium]